MGEDPSAADFARLFETVDEVTTPVAAETVGVLPSWLRGSVIRAGPGKFEFGGQRYDHWFDGMCILHKFSVNDGSVAYCSRYLRSNTFRANTESKRIAHSGFGTVASSDPHANIFKRFGAIFYPQEESDNTNINVIGSGNQVMVVGDSSYAHCVNATNLATERKTHLSLVDMTTAHPHYDTDGTMYNIGSTFKKGRPSYHLFTMPPPKPDAKGTGYDSRRVQIMASLPSRSRLSLSYYHSFGMTQNYVIFYEGPVVLDFVKALRCQLFGNPISEAITYHSHEKGRFHVFRKETGEKLDIVFTTEAYFFWHAINAYETDEGIVFDACIFKDFSCKDLFSLALTDIKSGRFHRSERWRKFEHYPGRFLLPLIRRTLRFTGGGKTDGREEIHVTPERLLPEGQDRIDMPTINYKSYNGKPYRYFYGNGSILKSWHFNSISKVDVETKSTKKWTGSGTQFPSEGIFVGNPFGRAEDDGVLLVSVCDVHPQKRDFLLCLDASTFTELARAYVPLDARVPYSLHGSFFAGIECGAPADYAAG